MPSPLSPQSAAPPRASRLGRRAGIAAASVLVSLVAAASSAPAASAATSCPDADETPAAVGGARSSAALLCLINYERGAVGLQPVSGDARLAQAAQWQADDMASRNYFAHQAPAPAPHGVNPEDRVDAAGYDWSATGENIGKGQPTPRTIVAAWLASPPHCTNIMSPKFTQTGFGISGAGTGGPYWVEVLARPNGTPAPTGPAVACPRTPAVPAPDGTGTGSGAGGTGTGTGGGSTGAGGSTRTSTGGNAGGGAASAGGSSMGTGSGTSTGGSSSGGATGPGREAGGDKSSATTSTKRITKAKASAKRKRKKLVVTLAIPSGTGKVGVTLKITQTGESRRTVRFRHLNRGQTYRLNVTLAASKKGRVVVTAGTARLAARFR